MRPVVVGLITMLFSLFQANAQSGTINPAPQGQQVVYTGAGSSSVVSGVPGTGVCSALASVAACISSSGSALIPPGTTGSFSQYNAVLATASCSVNAVSGTISIFPQAFGSGYTGSTVPVTVTGLPTGASLGTVTGNVVGGQITSYTITGANSGFIAGTGLGTLCPVTITVPAPAAPSTPIPVLNLNNSLTSYTPTVRPEDCGAAADGVTDDTQAINDCIQYVTNGGKAAGTLSFTSGKTYFVGSVSGTYTGAGDDGTVPVAATATCTASGGVVSICTVNPGSLGYGLTTKTITPVSIGSGTGAIFTPTLTLCDTTHCPNGNYGSYVSSIAVTGTSSGYPNSFTIYVGPTCSSVPCATLAPETPAQIGYSIQLAQFLTIQGNGAVIQGGFVGSAVSASTYTNSWPYVAIMGSTGNEPVSHVAIDNLNFVRAFIALGNVGSYWNVSNISVNGGAIAQGQNSQYSIWNNINVTKQASSMGGLFFGGQWAYRAPNTGSQAGNILNSFDLVDDLQVRNLNLYSFGASTLAAWIAQRKALDCWFDVNFFHLEDQGITNADGCYTPPGGTTRMPDQDVAALYVPDAMWRGFYGIVVAAYSRYGRPLNDLAFENVNAKTTSSYVMVLGPNDANTLAHHVGNESGGYCQGNTVYGSAACPNPYEPQNTNVTCLIMATGSAAGSFSDITGNANYSSSVCRPWQLLIAPTSAQGSNLFQLAGVPQFDPNSINPVLPSGSGAATTLSSEPFRSFQSGGGGLNADSGNIVLNGFKFKNGQNLFGTSSWIQGGRESVYAPGSPSVYEFSEWFLGNSLDNTAYLKMPGLRINPNAMAGGNVTAINITSGGSGYTPYSFVGCTIAASPQLLPGSSSTFYQSDCAAKAGPTGSVISATCTRCGVGYVSAPTVTFNPPSSGTTATGTTTINGIDAETPIQHLAACSFYLNAGGTVTSNSTTTLTSISCPGAIFNGSKSSAGDSLVPIAIGGTGGFGGLVVNAWVTAANTISVSLSNPTSTGISYNAGTSANPWIMAMMSGNLAGPLTPSVSTPTVSVGSPYIATPGTGSMTLTAGAAAGSSPTITCAASHACDSVSGTIALTTGSSATTGTLLTTTFPSAHSNQANCEFQIFLPATGQVGGWIPLESASAPGVTMVTALSSGTSYTIKYLCGGH